MSMQRKPTDNKPYAMYMYRCVRVRIIDPGHERAYKGNVRTIHYTLYMCISPRLRMSMREKPIYNRSDVHLTCIIKGHIKETYKL